MLDVRNLVVNSVVDETILERNIKPFLLSSVQAEMGTYFQIVLLIDGRRYRYGFTIDGKVIANEWLYGPAEGKETYYFQRTLGTVKVNPKWFPEGDNLPLEKMGKRALFLTFSSSYEGLISNIIRRFIENQILFDEFGQKSGRTQAGRERLKKNPTELLIEEGNKEVVLNWLRQAGIYCNDVYIEKNYFEDVETGNEILLSKNVFSKDGSIAGTKVLRLNSDESMGTIKYFNYIGQLYQVYKHGGIYISDEIDSNFHPALLKKIVGMFNNPAVNKANAQLLFTSHDTNLMHPEIMRRDQFYFTEKSNNDETILYALSDLKGIRNNADFARQYLAGFYGAMPVLRDFSMEENTTADHS
jgi:hypothetical protein